MLTIISHQIKGSGFHFTPTRIVGIKKWNIASCRWGLEKSEPSGVSAGEVKRCSHSGEVRQFLKELDVGYRRAPRSIPGTDPGEVKVRPHKHVKTGMPSIHHVLFSCRSNLLALRLWATENILRGERERLVWTGKIMRGLCLHVCLIFFPVMSYFWAMRRCLPLSITSL